MPASESDGRRSKVSPLLTAVLAASFGVLVWATLGDPVLHPQMSVETSLRETIYLTALALNAEQEETGTYPTTLEEIGMDEVGLVYQAEPSGYHLSATDEGIQVEYRSGEDLGPFRAAFEALMPPHLRIQ